MSHSNVPFLSVMELATKIQKKELSPVHVTEAYLNRIERLNGISKIYITIAKEPAKKAAYAAEDEIKRGIYRGFLHGIPYACKDLFLTKWTKTTGGSRVLEDWIPEYDAAVIERLSNAGSILLGKTNLHEFAYGVTGENPHYGTVPNPWDSTRIAGGSSSGSAAAVAAGLAPFALGTDTGGSVRVPAALCGIVGLKPTYGRVSCYGVIPYSWSLDHVGILTRSVEDAALILEVIAAYDHRDPVSVSIPVPPYSKEITNGIKGQRIGVPTSFFFEYVDPEIGESMRNALKIWEELGANVTEVELPSMEGIRTVSLVIQMPEALSYHSRYLPPKALLYGADFRSGLALGQFLLAEHYVKAKRMVEWYRRQMVPVFEKVDIVVTPTCPIVAPAIGIMTVTTEGREEVVGNALTRMTGFFNMTGHPAMSLPLGLHSSGLPMGVQLIGRHFEEATLFQIGNALEKHLEWKPLRPN